jgi:hypothetical protein
MKPKYDEIRRILFLASRRWFDFLNELNNPLFSKSYLPDETFLEQVYREMPLDEIREALILIAMHWNRVPEDKLRLGMLGLKFSKPHVLFWNAHFTNHPDQILIFTESVRRIDQIDFPIICPSYKNIDIDNPEAYAAVVSEYNAEMEDATSYPEPIIRAGIQLQLLQRGFKI